MKTVLIISLLVLQIFNTAHCSQNILGKVIHGVFDTLEEVAIKNLSPSRKIKDDYIFVDLEKLSEAKADFGAKTESIETNNEARDVEIEDKNETDNVECEDKNETDNVEADDKEANVYVDESQNNLERTSFGDNAQEESSKYKRVKGSANNVIKAFESPIDYNKIRAGLRRVVLEEPVKNHQTFFQVLENSYMGEYDFSKVEPKPLKVAKKKYRYAATDPNNLIPGAAGAKWNGMSGVGTIELNIQNGMNEHIMEVLSQKAPKTMKKFAYLSPKKLVEAEVLEDWLVDGLSLIYPNLTRQVQKYDAIALIILAVILRSFKDPSQFENIADLMTELKKYNGEEFIVLPRDLFEIPSGECATSSEVAADFQKQQLEKLFAVLDDGDGDYKLRFARCIVSQLNNLH